MKYRVTRNVSELPLAVSQVVSRELRAFDRRLGYLVVHGEVRLYEVATDPEPMKCCLIGMKTYNAGDLVATSVGHRWNEAIRDAFHRLRFQAGALIARPALETAAASRCPCADPAPTQPAVPLRVRRPSRGIRQKRIAANK